MSAASCILALAALLPQGGDPQGRELRGVEPLDLSAEDAPVQVQRRDEHVVQVVWSIGGAAEVQLPLTKPVRDLDVALAPDAETLVVLAGGVRADESLDLYLVADDGRIHVFETRGGRRLPARFNRGLGSWPMMEGKHLVLFAYQREGNLEFRALDTRGHVHASRTLAVSGEESIPGFRASWQLATGKVRVEFGEREMLEFPHPLAPRLEISEGLLDFGRRPVGRQASRAVDLRNSGHQPLVLEVSTDTDDFEVEGETSRVVAPGDRTEVRIVYRARVEGQANGRLDIRSNAANGRVSVSLRGEAVRVESVIEPAIQEPESAPEASSGPPFTPEPKLRPPAPPQPVLLEIEPLGETVRVRGWLAAPPAETAPPTRVRIRSAAGESRSAALGPGRAFEVEVTGVPGDELFLAVEDDSGRSSPESNLGRILPTLDVVDGELVIEGPARARFVLAAVQLDPGRRRIQRVLQHWAGRLDQEGVCRLLPEDLGLGTAALDLVVLLPEHGKGLLSNRVQWPER